MTNNNNNNNNAKKVYYANVHAWVYRYGYTGHI